MIQRRLPRQAKTGVEAAYFYHLVGGYYRGFGNIQPTGAMYTSVTAMWYWDGNLEESFALLGDFLLCRSRQPSRSISP
jgi:hypothetical protein